MKISVIIPVYNSEKTIEKTLRSLFTQTMLHGVEFILVNDNTPDQSMRIVQELMSEFGDSIKVYVFNHVMNRGSAAARQTGLDNANGEYIIHIDSDDWCEPTMLADLYQCAIESKADIVVCDFFVNFSCKQIYSSQQIGNNNMESIIKLLGGTLHGSLCNKLVKRELYVNNKICLIEGRNMWEDLTTSVKLFASAKVIVHLKQAYLHYMRISENSYTSNVSKKSLEDIAFAVNNIVDFIVNKNMTKELEKGCIYLKICAKEQFVQYSRGIQQKNYTYFYPDVDRYIFSNPSLPLYYKIALWLCTHNFLCVGNVIFDTVKMLKHYIR